VTVLGDYKLNAESQNVCCVASRYLTEGAGQIEILKSVWNAIERCRVYHNTYSYHDTSILDQ